MTDIKCYVRECKYYKDFKCTSADISIDRDSKCWSFELSDEARKQLVNFGEESETGSEDV